MCYNLQAGWPCKFVFNLGWYRKKAHIIKSGEYRKKDKLSAFHNEHVEPIKKAKGNEENNCRRIRRKACSGILAGEIVGWHGPDAPPEDRSPLCSSPGAAPPSPLSSLCPSYPTFSLSLIFSLEKRRDEGLGFSPRIARSTLFFTQTHSATHTATRSHPDGWPRHHPPNWKGTTWSKTDGRMFDSQLRRTKIFTQWQNVRSRSLRARDGTGMAGTLAAFICSITGIWKVGLTYCLPSTFGGLNWRVGRHGSLSSGLSFAANLPLSLGAPG